MQKKLFKGLSLVILFLLLTLSANAKDNGKSDGKSKDLTEFTKARIKTEKGDIVFSFMSDKAPKTVNRIKFLVQSKFYNGIKFHRVIPGFVAQAGDPTGTGQGGSGQNLPAEFSKIKHAPGIVAMARKGNDINSADSQFYITLGTPSHLDGQYTIFGKVTSGLDVANKIAQDDVIKEMTLE